MEKNRPSGKHFRCDYSRGQSESRQSFHHMQSRDRTGCLEGDKTRALPQKRGNQVVLTVALAARGFVTVVAFNAAGSITVTGAAPGGMIFATT